MRKRDAIDGRDPKPPEARWRIMAVCALLVGCNASGPPAMQLPARQLFANRAWPALTRCAGCHATRPTIDFLAPGTPTEAYATMFAFEPPVLDVASPASSLLVTMGKHTGPAMLPAESDAVLAWLEAEHAERAPDPGAPVVVGPVSLVPGALNTIDLGLGATLRFVPSAAAAGLALHQIELVAGAGGLHVVHPLFVAYPRLGPPRIDAADAFGDVDLKLAPGAVERLAGGDADLLGFFADEPIRIQFLALETP